MYYSWLNKKDSKNLIVFFNGWGMNETPVKHLETLDNDILMLYDYRDINFDFSEFDFNKYDKKSVLAWSMGVYVINLFYEKFNNFDLKIAINGTSNVIDDNFGIPKRIYDVTIKFLSEASIDKFIKNMFKNGEINPEIKITRTTSELKDELISIKNMPVLDKIDFDKVIISDDDRIIPVKNQINFWKNKNIPIKIINGTHCPFKNYSSWQELCQII